MIFYQLEFLAKNHLFYKLTLLSNLSSNKITLFGENVNLNYTIKHRTGADWWLRGFIHAQHCGWGIVQIHWQGHSQGIPHPYPTRGGAYCTTSWWVGNTHCHAHYYAMPIQVVDCVCDSFLCLLLTLVTYVMPWSRCQRQRGLPCSLPDHWDPLCTYVQLLRTKWSFLRSTEPSRDTRKRGWAFFLTESSE